VGSAKASFKYVTLSPTASPASDNARRTSRYISVSIAAPVTANSAEYHNVRRPRIVNLETILSL
jgi:hypothetical protein